MNELADRLLAARAAAKAATEEVKKIEAAIIAAGDSPIEGILARVTVSTYDRETVDWKAIAAKFKPSRQLVTAYTKTGTVTRVTCTARAKEAA